MMTQIPQDTKYFSWKPQYWLFVQGTIQKYVFIIILLKKSFEFLLLVFQDETNEIFESFIWSLPYELVQYRHSIKIDERIKIFSKASKYQQYSVIFRSNEKKREFLAKLDEILTKHSNFTSFVDN